MSVLSYAQKIGQALMVPVAVLPAAAVLMGIGYWLDPDGWGANSQLAALLIKSGAAIIDNMGLLFAVGVAFGLSKDKHGSAALSGLVGYYVVTTLLAPGGVAQLQHIDPSQVPTAFGKINNQFIGILIGVLSAELYNRFYQVELPKALSFFSGKRLVPIVVSFAMIALSFVLLYVWPYIFNALVSFGESIKDLGALGAGIYGFFNRLLIPVGLHHALNSVFWFDVAGINDIPNFLGGAKSIAEGTATVGITGMYQAGFFPVMMFGLPGAALAIYQCAKPSQKVKVASIMLAGAFASFFTGITEPLEFSFMFVAPILYVLHALLTGISVFIAASMHWIAGFGFSAGLVDMVLSSRNPLAVDWYMLPVQGLVFFAIYYLVFRFAIQAFNLKTIGRTEETEETEESVPAPSVNNQSREERAVKFIDALGGADNFKTIDACITRLRLTLVDRNKINEEQLKSLGSKSNVKLGNDGLQVILGPEAELMAEAIKAKVK
ncbi:N-acetylglucosamine-specific PTS transporter subunit IIBC [Aggregatibacter actinomycetemcomitans]|uniref:N-acetylglucosamine-specific PTS transporter subunit IIBC n=1 Tax=Aggregatibacter actinomycetemcomitans TaxID=714 RepID=UPI0011DCAAED|nr:N-acetylglucosamine-specific PTS transporter subunit IIBC [Aggregatibacter actinomycetemcomitans]QEH49985.1 PTS glucose transporter subunit IIBC [Aggregatibacter actinomycetemcomitans]